MLAWIAGWGFGGAVGLGTGVVFNCGEEDAVDIG